MRRSRSVDSDPVAGGSWLNVPVPNDLLKEAEKFVPFIREQIRSCQQVAIDPIE